MMAESYERHTASLGHVLWIGGATDSGKTSVARAVAEKHSLQTYHYDHFDRERLPGHWARVDPARHPHMYATPIHDHDRMWVHTTPEDLVKRWLHTAPERFQLSLEDLLALPSAPPIVAEGYGFTPDLVLPLLSSTRQAIWLVSTAEFKRASYARRDKGSFIDTSNPLRARHNHFQRDLLLGEYFKQRAEYLQLKVMTVDGTLSLEQIIPLVEAHFNPFL
jgi:adenylate kinase family enzyme